MLRLVGVCSIRERLPPSRPAAIAAGLMDATSKDCPYPQTATANAATTKLGRRGTDTLESHPKTRWPDVAPALLPTHGEASPSVAFTPIFAPPALFDNRVHASAPLWHPPIL